MWRTGSSFDGEEFRLSDPALYRVLDSDDERAMEIVDMDPRPAPRNGRRDRGRQRRGRQSEEETW